MRPMTKILCALALIPVSVTAPALAEPIIDKDKVLTSLRKSVSLPPGWEMDLTHLENAPVPGMVQAVLRIFAKDAEQNRAIFISTDSRYYILGSIYDTSVDLDTVRRNMINTSSAPYKGRADAPVSVVMFTDPGCSSCKEAHRAIDDEKLIEGYKGKVKLVFKPFPLKSHPGSFDAVAAAFCAGKKDPKLFWRYIDAVFARKDPIPAERSREILMGIAKDLKLKMKDFETCYDRKEAADPVTESIEEGKNLGVQSTPTFFINGRVYVGFHGVENLKKAIDEFLPK